MSAESGDRPELSRPIVGVQLLIEEASRQLSICNSCRYCEGLCAVYPALERRSVFDGGDIGHLANLCHDCRACLDACMYAPPHAYAVDIPAVLAAVRVEDYRRHVWPTNPPRWLRGKLGVIASGFLAVVLVLGLAIANVGLSGLVRTYEPAGSPYDLLPYWQLLVLMLASGMYAFVIMAMAAVRYWHASGPAPGTLSRAALWDATSAALTLRNLRGGGADCFYPEEHEPSAARRRWHGLTGWGFMLCFASTVSAAVLQDLLGSEPPYGWLSVPVLAGLVGGVALLLGTTGLLVLKFGATTAGTAPEMTIKDYGLISALWLLALTGLLTLFTRTTAAFGPVLLVHLAAVALAFACAPYSKFPHFIYRCIALVRDSVETAAEKR